MNNDITIFISESDAIKWQQFQKNYEIINILMAKGIFDIKYGKATLNFAQGQLKNVTKEEIVWHK